MTLSEFREHPTYPGRWAKELEQNEILRIVLDTMEMNHPARFTVKGDVQGDISPTQASIELGITRGYSQYSNGLKLLAARKPKPADLGEPTYAEAKPEEM